MNNNDNIYKLQNYSHTRTGKTLRKNHFFFSGYGRRKYTVGDYSIYHYVGRCEVSIYITPRIVPDGFAWGMHYGAGEYPRNGWRELYRPRNRGHSRRSSRLRRASEKRAFKKELAEYGYM